MSEPIMQTQDVPTQREAYATYTPGLGQQLPALFRVAMRLDALGITIAGVHWKMFEQPTIQVQSRADLERVVGEFGLRVGEPYGDYRYPIIKATGIVDDLHVSVFGPARH